MKLTYSLNNKEYLKIKNEIYKYIIDEFITNGIDINLIFLAMLDTITTTVHSKSINQLINQIKQELLKNYKDISSRNLSK